MAMSGLDSAFTGGTAQHAYDVHLLAKRSDGSLVDQQMNFSPGEAVYYRSHGLMRPLDVDKLADSGVLPNADRTATYYSFDDYAKAVTLDYNEAQKGATEIYNKIFDVVDPSRPELRQVVAAGVDDYANMDWNTTVYLMQYAEKAARDYMRQNGSDPDIKSLMEQAQLSQQLITNTGASIQEAATFSAQLKQPGPAGSDFTHNDLDFRDFLTNVPGLGTGMEARV